MNSFGNVFRVEIFGESHGPAVGVTIDGCPPGLKLTRDEFTEDLGRRRAGAHGTTTRVEADVPNIVSGLFEGKTTGAPITILFENRDTDSKAYEKIKNTPRPGHADFAAHMKYKGFHDYRGGGQFSGRLTVGLVAAGVIAKKLISPMNILAKLIEVGGSADTEAKVEAAVKASDSIGGLIECRCKDVPVGLGEPFFDSVESLIAHAAFSIPGIKGIEFGKGFACTAMSGSEYNDIIEDSDGHTKTNNTGGITGGLSNGNDIVFRVAVRPTASIAKEQETVDLKTGKKTKIKIEGRHDSCIALRAPVIVEATTAIVLANLLVVRSASRELR